MRRYLLALLALNLVSSAALAADFTRKTVVVLENPNPALPAALVAPEGRTRWDLTGLAGSGKMTVTIASKGSAVTVTETPAAGGADAARKTVYTDYLDPEKGDAALQWLFPDRYADELRPGRRQEIDLVEESASGTDRLRIETETVGIGWVHLPSGPHEVVLQRALVLRAAGGGRDLEPDRLVHRWIDPRAGVVAEVWGPVAPGGRGRLAIGGAETLDAVIQGASTLTIHLSEIRSGNYSGLTYGFDLAAGTTVPSLDPNGYTTVGDLVAQSQWDFSGNTQGNDIAFTTVPVNPAQTCNYAQCGYTDPNGQLERSDKNFDNTDPNTWVKTNDVVVYEPRAMDDTIWIRAGAQNEGVSGSFGSGESRFCYVDFGGVTRTQVPLWRFSHPSDGSSERYFQVGDSWAGGPFNCEQNLFNQVCGASGLFDHLYSKACTGSDGQPHYGTQSTEILKGGVVTIPSGHTFNALVIRTIADFCVYLGASCSSLGKVDEVRTVNYLWQVPVIGTVARMQSVQNTPDPNTFTTLAETNMVFGLLPPRSITVTGSTDTTVSLSWDPGLITSRITGYKIYWNTTSGSSGAYAFNSVANPGQVSFAGTTAEVSGLQAGTTYYFTVTSLGEFPVDPNTGAYPQHQYESMLYPTTVSGDPSFVYPAEVQATTTGGTCIPTAEIANVTAGTTAGSLDLCWDASADPCLAGYRVPGSGTADTDAGYSTVAQPGLMTCWSGNPSEIYYLITAEGTGGDGPWGHYGH